MKKLKQLLIDYRNEKIILEKEAVFIYGSNKDVCKECAQSYPECPHCRQYIEVEE